MTTLFNYNFIIKPKTPFIIGRKHLCHLSSCTSQHNLWTNPMDLRPGLYQINDIIYQFFSMTVAYRRSVKHLTLVCVPDDANNK